MRIPRQFLALVALVSLQSCISYAPATLVPAITLSPEQISTLAPTSSRGGELDFGLDVTLNESDSLFNLETLPGMRVRGVAPDGPAAAAGIRAGDIILAIDDLPTDHPDALAALQQQAAGNGPFTFRLRRNTRLLETAVTPRVIQQRTEAVELYRVDPLATRAGYATELVMIEQRPDIAAARVREFFPDSPLPSAGINVGDLILTLDGRPISSAQNLINRLNQDHELGDRVVLGVFDGSDMRSVEVRLWNPGRRISRIAFGPLLQYESHLSPDSASLSILDFWLFSLYDYNRNEGERSHSLLGIFNVSSDFGELTEVEN